MKAHADAILEAALNLPTKQRAMIAERLIRSLDGPEPTAAAQAEIDAARADEIRRRVRRIDDGTDKLIPAEQVTREVRSILKRRRIDRKRDGGRN